MVATFESVQKMGKDQFEAMSAAGAAFTKNWQSIATEATDYSKKSFERTRALAEKLISVKKIDEAIELQTEYARGWYEDFVAESSKFADLYTNLAKDAFKPIESATKAYTPAE